MISNKLEAFRRESGHAHSWCFEDDGSFIDGTSENFETISDDRLLSTKVKRNENLGLYSYIKKDNFIDCHTFGKLNQLTRQFKFVCCNNTFIKHTQFSE